MLNTYNSPIAVVLGGVAPKPSAQEAGRLRRQSLAAGSTHGLVLADIAAASARATAANGLEPRRKPHGDPIRR